MADRIQNRRDDWGGGLLFQTGCESDFLKIYRGVLDTGGQGIGRSKGSTGEWQGGSGRINSNGRVVTRHLMQRYPGSGGLNIRRLARDGKHVRSNVVVAIQWAARFPAAARLAWKKRQRSKGVRARAPDGIEPGCCRIWMGRGVSQAASGSDVRAPAWPGQRDRRGASATEPDPQRRTLCRRARVA